LEIDARFCWICDRSIKLGVLGLTYPEMDEGDVVFSFRAVVLFEGLSVAPACSVSSPKRSLLS
jgi:hypothetical protein